MKQFESRHCFHEFVYIVQRSRRFIQDNKINQFLETVLETCSNRIVNVNKGTILWRAQLGNETTPMFRNGEVVAQEEKPFSDKRMKPLHDQASEGRINPKGIPCLYLATERDTALAEVRPWIGALITVAQFEVTKDLRVVDCSKHCRHKAPYNLGDLNPAEIETLIWSYIDTAFSRPIQESDQKPEYAPTQIIAELFRVNGFDGIKYQSSLGKGQNLSLFGLNCAKVKSCILYETEKIEFSFSEAANPPRSTRISLFKRGID